jgi:hypothetical protein
MIPSLVHTLPAWLVAGLTVFLTLESLARRLPGRRIPPLALLGASLLLVAVPLGSGLSVVRIILGITPGFSIPLMAVLVSETQRRLGGSAFLRESEAPWLWGFGVVGGLLLYPSALGGLPWDTYAMGWGDPVLFVSIGLLAAGLLAVGNRYGWILLLAIVAWHLRLMESINYWDYLIDPVYVVLALPLGLRASLRRRRSAGVHPVGAPTD